MGRHKKEEQISSPPKQPNCLESDTEPINNIGSVSLPLTISSGSTLLNLALTNTIDGGWGVGRIANIVGDKSSGKSLICIEAVNYVLKILGKQYKVKVIYNETEAAFDKDLAIQLGMPIDQVEFHQSTTIEDWYKDVLNEVENIEDTDLIIYVLDSLDALSDSSEMEREIDKSSFGAEKAKKTSELFRRLIRKINETKMVLLIVSQTRDRIGVTFGEKKTRSGGKALDFYASQIVWLAEIEKLKNKDRIVGVGIKAKIKKNKIAKPFREAIFPILFGYGIDDMGSMVDFLKDNKVCVAGNRFEWQEKTYSREDFIKFIENNNLENEIKKLVKQTWDKLEFESQIIRKSKYEESKK